MAAFVCLSIGGCARVCGTRGLQMSELNPARWLRCQPALSRVPACVWYPRLSRWSDSALTMVSFFPSQAAPQPPRALPRPPRWPAGSIHSGWEKSQNGSGGFFKGGTGAGSQGRPSAPAQTSRAQGGREPPPRARERRLSPGYGTASVSPRLRSSGGQGGGQGGRAGAPGAPSVGAPLPPLESESRAPSRTPRSHSPPARAGSHTSLPAPVPRLCWRIFQGRDGGNHQGPGPGSGGTSGAPSEPPPPRIRPRDAFSDTFRHPVGPGVRGPPRHPHRGLPLTEAVPTSPPSAR